MTDHDAANDYLFLLTARIAAGISRLPPEFCARHAGYLQRTQNADGGFSGREGGSDLYYTGFGLRGLAVLDALTPEICGRAAKFLGSCLNRQTSVIDLFSFLYACLLVQMGGGPDVLVGSADGWEERLVETLETFRTPDGGYAKTPGGRSGSTYHTFLVGLCYQLLGRSLPRAADAGHFIRLRRRDDGGFVEIAPMRRSGTNPTAAAIGVLQMLGDGLTIASSRGADILKGTVEFLAAMQSSEGGLQANGRAPLADLLSTFTGLWTLSDLGAANRIDAGGVLRYVQALELPGGGFRGGLWDDQTDVEYTFYGLGCRALIHTAE